MGKKTTKHQRQPQAAQPGDVHASITREAASLRAAVRPALLDADDLPALGPLLDSARAALERAIPARFDHEGKTYFLRVSVGMARLMVFDSPSAFTPIALALSGSFDEFGHTPCH
jgi:hypothetical protein